MRAHSVEQAAGFAPPNFDQGPNSFAAADELPPPEEDEPPPLDEPPPPDALAADA
jgi:hypothetical protein